MNTSTLAPLRHTYVISKTDLKVGDSVRDSACANSPEYHGKITRFDGRYCTVLMANGKSCTAMPIELVRV